MSGDIVGCHNCVWRSPAPSGWGPGLLLNTLPYKAPGPKVHEPRGCRTLGWVVSEEISNCTIWFPCGGLCLPDHQLEAVTTHSCSPSRPPLCSSCTAGEGLPLPHHSQDSDQANAPLPSPPQATQTRRMEAHNHHGCH